MPVHPLGDAFPVQIGRDAAKMERPAGAEHQTQVDIHGRCDHCFVQHQADLLGKRCQRPLADLAGRARLVADGQQPRVSSLTYGLPSAVQS